MLALIVLLSILGFFIVSKIQRQIILRCQVISKSDIWGITRILGFLIWSLACILFFVVFVWGYWDRGKSEKEKVRCDFAQLLLAAFTESALWSACSATCSSFFGYTERAPSLSLSLSWIQRVLASTFSVRISTLDRAENHYSNREVDELDEQKVNFKSQPNKEKSYLYIPVMGIINK